MKILLTAALLCAIVSTDALAQQSVGSISGKVRLRTTEQAGSLRVEVEEVTTEAKVELAEVDTSGSFTVRNLPFGTYDLYLFEHEHSVFAKRVTVNSAIPFCVNIEAIPDFSGTEITVTDTHLESTQPTIHTLFTAPVIASLPVTNPARQVEAILLNSPGVVPDEDGRLHMRGEDAMLQFVIDGIPLTSNQTRIYAPLFNSGLVESADMLRGSLDPEYGVATSGILNISTKSGFDKPSFGQIEYSTGSFNNASQSVDFGGHVGQAFAFYGAYGGFTSDRYLDPVSGFDPDHTGGSGTNYFGKINIIASDRLDITALGYYAATSYQIPNGSLSSLQDQVQDLISYMFGARVNYSLSASSAVSVLGYTRRQSADLTSNGLDRITTASDSLTALSSERFFVGAHRKDIESGAQLEYAAKTDWVGEENEFKLGIGGEVFPLSEFFTFAVTDTNVSSPYIAGGDARYAPYDLKRGGKPFLVDTSATGKRISAFVQDRFTTGAWTLSGGIRFDLYDLLQQESAMSPRLNAMYSVSDQLVLHASYNRIFMEAPIENFLVSSSDATGALVGAAQGSAPRVVQSEKAHVLELGAGYALNKYLSFDLTSYGKLIDNMVVKVELGNSGMIFPANIKQGIVAGGDLEVKLRDWNNFSGRIAFSTIVSKGVVPSDGTSPFAAGLVLGEEGKNYSHPFGGEDMFNTEHNQLLTSSFLLRYDHPSGIFALVGGRFDSGLPFDLVDTNGVGPDETRSREILLKRGYSDATINMLNLVSDMPGSPDKSVAAHATFDFSLGGSLQPLGIPLKLTGTVLNIFDTRYLIKFESTFGGTHFGNPRMFLLRAELAQ